MSRRTDAGRHTDTPDARTRRRRRPDLAGRHRASHDGERAPRSAASRHPSNDAARPSRARAATRTTRPISANSPKTSNDLEKFVPWSDLDPVYFDSSYYLYPDSPVAVEMLRVIGAAMAEAGVVRPGRLTARADGCRRAARHRDGSFHFACRGG